jgi:hypothetical protein
VCEDEGEGGG